MTNCESRHSLNGETVYFVLLEFPSENQEDENLAWLQTCRSEVERFCDEQCFRIGALHILPKPYFPMVEGFLKKAKVEYNRRGYNPIFKFLRADIRGEDYLNLQALILERIRSRLEICLNRLEREEFSDNLLSDALRDVAKANELMLIFQLGKAFPSDATRVYDLLSVLNEKISEFKLHKSKKVLVAEL